MEEHILADPRAGSPTDLYKVKQRLARFRRYVLPVSRMVGTVVEQGNIGAAIALIDAQFGAYFRDVYDHTLRITDQVRNVQDLTDALIELVRVEATNVQNEVTKRLTGWAAIIAVPTFIASVYGMNFELVPQHGRVEGFYFALAMMAVTALGLYTYFKKREWI
jgi:magnesium transporter